MVRPTSLLYIQFAFVLAANAATPSVAISPATVSIRAGSAKQFTAGLHGVTGPAAWTVNGVAGGNATIGTISETGLYTAPLANPGTTVTIRATAGNPPLFAEATVTWLNPQPSISSFAPAKVNIGSFSLTVNGKGFVGGSQILLNGAPAATTMLSSTALSFQSTINTAGSVTIAVANPDPGAFTSSVHTLTVMPPISVAVSPAKTNIRLGVARKFSASVSNALVKTVTWAVDGVQGGSAATGMIAADGTYTAPLVMPADNQITINATSTADSTATAQSAVTLLNPVPVIQSLTPNPLTYGADTITITGTGFVAGSQLKLGSTLFLTQFVSPTQLTATATLSPTPGGLLAFRVTNPDPGAATSAISVVPVQSANPKVSYLAAARFLEQASWGPDAASIAHVQDIGFDAWISEQLAAPVSLYKTSNDSSDTLVKQQSEFFVHAMQGPDQLRQRVAFALSQIFVVSGLKTGEPRQMVPYQNMLLADAFGTYLNVLRDVTLSPTMGVYLDMVNNDKGDPSAGTAPNENYGREVMQLFSVGTVLLNPDGSTQVDGSGQPIPAYDQNTMTNMAHAFTGWTFPGKAITHGHNPENYSGPMIAVEANHDEGAKTILGGVNLPAGETAQQDLDAVLEELATHPNTAPFISLRLIEHLVTSNPSPAYIARISQVFTSTDGDLSQVVRAILLDPEARQGDDPGNAPQVTGGHLREPILFVLAMMRNISASVVNNNPIEGLASDMGQTLFYSPSVFNYYSPLYHLSNGLQAPEFQTLSSATALVRANVVQDLVARNLDGDIHWDMTPFTQLAASPPDLVNAIDNAFLYGRMPAALKAEIVTAITAATNNADRVRNAIYLMATSSLYQVEH
jgi:uncharacterized protein (DUF1800 family)